MRPAALILIGIGFTLCGGTAIWLSLVIPVQTEHRRPSNNELLSIECNLWGQPISAVHLSNMTLSGGARPSLESWVVEQGPYPRGVRQGRWRREVRGKDGNVTTSEHWFRDGKEIDDAQWDQGR
jgi:hypothetical protein